MPSRLLTSAAAACVALALTLAAAPIAAAAERVEKPSQSAAQLLAQQQRGSRPLWQLPLAGALVENMQLLTPDRLLVALRADATGTPNRAILLVNTRKGIELWRHEREAKQARWDLVLADSVGLVYRVDDGRRPKLLALDARDGREAWSVPMAAGAVPLADRSRGTLLVIEAERSRVTLRSLAFADGSERWRRAIPVTRAGAARTRPLFVDGDVVQLVAGVERLAGADGHAVWTRADLVVPDGAPDARLDGDALFAVVAGGTLAELDATSGATRRSVALPAGVDWDAIEIADTRVYARGLRADGGPVLAAVERASGTVAWAHECEAPPMSNVVELGDRVYVATSGRVLALDARTGASLGNWEATNASRPYPVHLRQVNGRIVFIGELMVAGFDASTGAKLWSRGWSPISNSASLVALDASLPFLRGELAELSGRKKSAAKTGEDASYARVESARFANMAADYSRRADALSASIARTPGTSQNERSIARLGVSIERQSAIGARSAEISLMRMNQRLDRAMSMMNFQFALMDLAASIERAKVIAGVRTALDRQLLFRNAVLGGYAGMEDAAHVYRPGMEMGAGGGYVGVTVVGLASGKASTEFLSPLYREYGLWNVVDFERGVVYHDGIGLEPSLHQLLPARDVGGGSARIVGNYVIAAPIRIPDD